MARLEPHKDRLISLHLHDNDGSGDQHGLPFTGTVDWSELTRIIAESTYAKRVSLETAIHNTGIEDEPEFLGKAFKTATKLARMIDEHRAV